MVSKVVTEVHVKTGVTPARGQSFHPSLLPMRFNLIILQDLLEQTWTTKDLSMRTQVYETSPFSFLIYSEITAQRR